MTADILERKQMILEGKVVPNLLRLSFPTMMYGAVQAICPLTDSYFINNYIGRIAGSAVSYSGTLINMISAAALGIGVAGSAIIGQTNGKGDSRRSEQISLQMLVLVFIIGVIMMPVLLGLAFIVKTKVGADIATNVEKYLVYSCAIIPITYLEAAYNSIKNACGEPEKPFVRMSFMLVLKLIFNLIFIKQLKWGIFGAVLSTFISNILILIWMVYDLFISPHGSRYSFKGFKNDKNMIAKIIKLGIPSMLNNFILYLGFFLITVQIEKYGTAVLNGQGIANNIMLICYTVPQAFAMGVTTMTAMNIGARNEKKAKLSCIAGNVASVITSVILASIVWLCAEKLAGCFTSDPEVMKIIIEYLHICTFSVPAFGILMVNMGAFNGLGKTAIALVIGILRVWVFRYAFMLITDSILYYRSIFWGDLFSNYICAAITVIIALKIKWESEI